MNELPELPKPYGSGIEIPPADQWTDAWIASEDAYTAEQMRSYALSAVQMERERCAKICDEALKDYSSPNEEDFTSEIPWEAESIGGIGMAKRLAAAIRSPSKEGD